MVVSSSFDKTVKVRSLEADLTIKAVMAEADIARVSTSSQAIITSPGNNKYIISKSFTSASASYAFYTGPSGGLVFYVTTSNGIMASPAASASPPPPAARTTAKAATSPCRSPRLKPSTSSMKACTARSSKLSRRVHAAIPRVDAGAKLRNSPSQPNLP